MISFSCLDDFWKSLAKTVMKYEWNDCLKTQLLRCVMLFFFSLYLNETINIIKRWCMLRTIHSHTISSACNVIDHGYTAVPLDNHIWCQSMIVDNKSWTVNCPDWSAVNDDRILVQFFLPVQLASVNCQYAKHERYSSDCFSYSLTSDQPNMQHTICHGVEVINLTSGVKTDGFAVTFYINMPENDKMIFLFATESFIYSVFTCAINPLWTHCHCNC